MHHRILELYSGIGGMHCAWLVSCLNGNVVAAVDINTVANNVYQHNFPKTSLINRNIQSITAKEIESMNVNTILMSPPCQPFTRNGKNRDENDPRTDSFLCFINILEELDTIEYILLENVKGFESSVVCKLFISKLKDCKFKFQEFLLCPSSFGVPNSRLRYYCIARRTDSEWAFERKNYLMTTLQRNYDEPYMLENILEKNVSETFLVNDKLLKHANTMDVCYSNSRRSCCFTKAYSHYADGTGSIHTDASPGEVVETFKKANKCEVGSDEFIKLLKKLKFRFFTPKEILAIMHFPEKIAFPEDITRKQCYRLLGNSVNVKVISELLKILFK